MRTAELPAVVTATKVAAAAKSSGHGARVVRRVERWHYIEAATDRLLSTVQLRSMMSNDVFAGSATANSGTCSPQSPIGKRVFLVSVGPSVPRLSTVKILYHKNS